MKDTTSLLLPVDSNSRIVTPSDGYHRYRSLSDLNMADPNLQPEAEGGMGPNINQGTPQLFDQSWVLEQGVGAEEEAATPPFAEDEVRISFFSDSSSDGAASLERLSPRAVQAGPGTTTPRTSSPAPRSAIDSDGPQSSSDHWVISPEERALMTNSATVARDRRRRRGAVQVDASPEPVFPSPPSPALLSSPPLSRVRSDSSDHYNSPGFVSPAAYDAYKAPPRARLQRSFTPSERDAAGVVLVPGLLRRLGHPFSGPWQGPSSPLASVSAADVPHVSRLSRLRRFFSRRR